ncbi:MD-2-related lipid-recognition protein-like [Anopheles cruzii]|uniref:MD-2-related lipid-recognition protein-like n=1 Tax=Anopheles cruzii TaxID=68878 RepID=UPI0022EC90B3|nr:MD-2-related lipid-recognition protein-like [Anopheles cruzii]
MKCCYRVILSAALVALSLAEVINFQKCPGVEEKCSIRQVSVTPCPDAAKELPCTILRGSNVSISFDFTPKFAANELTADVSWTQPAFDLPFIGMDTAACKHTACPVESGKQQHYSYDLNIKKSYPPQHYDVKWKLTSENNESCCFILQINISKKVKRT